MGQWERREDYDEKAHCVQIEDQAKVLFQQIAGPALEDYGEQLCNTETRVDAVHAEIDL